MLALYAATLALSATLLLSVQPLVGKQVLPLLGGTPGVWNTCLVFFQGALLLGYLYAHGLQRLPLRRQLPLHAGVLGLGLLLLPPAAAAAPPEGAHPALFLLLSLVRRIGLPFLALSATAPLVMRWFGTTAHRQARDPHLLYAVSNLGSLAALLAYPTLIEPHLPLRQQGRLFSLGYGLLCALILSCAVLALHRPAAAVQPDEDTPAPSLRRRLRWLACAAVPAALLYGVTTFLSTDIAAIPLLWVVPLSLYLLSFVLVFSRQPPSVHGLFVRLFPLLCLVLVYCGVLRSLQGAHVLLLHLATFFAGAMVCHGELARDRPGPRHLTAYYLHLSAGGVLGGLFCALLAPLLFTSLLEYPLALILACMLLPGPAERDRPTLLYVSLPLLIGLSCAGLTWLVMNQPAALRRLGELLHLDLEESLIGLVYALPLVLCYAFLRSSVRFAIGIGAVAVAALIASEVRRPALYRERSFFGVLTVRADGEVHALYSGTTLHGRQHTGERRREPLSYFHREGPVGQVFSAFPAGEVALVGLGAGALCAYGKPGQRFTFYEIDPAVVRVARDPRLFTYLSDCRAAVRVVLGDARLRLAEAQARGEPRAGLLIVDAFSSDAIPVHLLTREALRLYFDRLTGTGILAVHISNRYFRLQPVLGSLARDAGLVGLTREDPEDRAKLKDRSAWVALARERAHLGTLLSDAKWRPLPDAPGARPWSDDFSDPFRYFRWRR